MANGVDVLLGMKSGAEPANGIDFLLGKGQSAATQIANDQITKGAQAFPSQGSDALGGVSQFALNLLSGGVRGAGSIGATLMRPFESSADNQQRRADMDAGLTQFGAQPDSLTYKGGKLGAEVAGTAGVGGAIAAPVRAVATLAPKAAPVLDAVATALQTGGFRAPGLTGLPGVATRVGAGAITGGASAGLVDPGAAGTGAVIGAVLPPAVQGAGMAGQFISDKMRAGAGRLMQSAIKPTLQQLRSGDAATATQTMLQRGINPNAAGLEKLQSLVDDTDTAISSAIQGSNAQIDKNAVLGSLNGTRQQFTNQVAPQADLSAIQAAQDAFLAHPNYPGQTIPVQDAQALKQGTYRVLAKKYGQMGSADTEAQKAIARGLKDEIAAAVPEISGLNSQQSDLLKTLQVVQRRALMEGNKNPFGLSLLAPSPKGIASFMADRSALLKSLAARGLYSASNPVGASFGLLSNPALLPYVRGGLLASEANP